MNIFSKIWNVLRHPVHFWEMVEQEHGNAKTAIDAAVLCVAGAMISSAILFISTGDSILRIASILKLSPSITIIIFVAFLYVCYFFAFLINAFVLFIVAKILRGSGTFAQTYKTVVYGTTPIILFGMLPVIGPFLSLWMEFLKVSGMRRFHRMSFLRALTTSFLADLFLIASVFIISLFSFFAIVGLTTRQDFSRRVSSTSSENAQYASRSSAQASSSLSVQIDEIAYKNDLHNFSMQYPSDWHTGEYYPGGRSGRQYNADLVVEFIRPFRAGDEYRALNGIRLLLFQNETLEGYLDHQEQVSLDETKRFRDLHPEYKQIRVNDFVGITYEREVADMVDSQEINPLVLQVGPHILEIEIVRSDMTALRQYVDSLQVISTPDQSLSEHSIPMNVPREPLFIGQIDAPVTMTMFTDYQVGASLVFWESTYPRLVDRYIQAGKLRIVIRHYPLSFNVMAHYAASMVECARFEDEAAALKLHEALSTRMNPWENNLENWFIVQLSKQPTLNIDTLQECDRLGMASARLNQDAAIAEAYGVTPETGIPQFFLSTISGEASILGAKDAHYFFEVIDGLLSAM